VGFIKHIARIGEGGQCGSPHHGKRGIFVEEVRLEDGDEWKVSKLRDGRELFSLADDRLCLASLPSFGYRFTRDLRFLQRVSPLLLVLGAFARGRPPRPRGYIRKMHRSLCPNEYENRQSIERLRYK